VYLYVPDDAATLPSGWSQHVRYSLAVVSQTNERCDVKVDQTSNTFDASGFGCGCTQFIALTALSDASKGYIVNDTLIQCDMTNVPSSAHTAAAAPAAPRETGIVDVDTAAAAAISAAYPGALPIIAADSTAAAATAAAATSNPAAGTTGAAPRVAVPAGLYPTGTGGLVYLHPGARVNY